MITNLTTEQRKELSNKRMNMIVSPYEAAVIEELRKLAHGEVVVTVLDGIPYRVKLNISVMMEQSDQFEIILAKIVKQGIIK